MEIRIVRFAIMLCVSMAVSSLSHAQVKDTPDSLSLIDRFSFRTNAFEWLVTIPNVGVEFDLSASPYRKTTIGLNARYNWRTWHNYSPPMVFNLSEIRPEFRKYWRPVDKEPRDPSDTTKRTFFQWLKEDVFTNGKVNAKTGRAYYIGAYAHAGTYAFKFGQVGKQGSFYGAGVSLGYGVPLYSYTKSAIDVEFGFSLGLLMTKYESFGHNPVGNYYFQYEDQGKDWHFVPYPVLSEIKVAFVYRTRSIKDKYNKTDPAKIMKKQDRIDAKTQARLEKEQAKIDKEAAKAQAKADKEQAKANKEQAKIDKETAKTQAKTDKEQSKAEGIDKKAAKLQAKADKEQAKIDKEAAKLQAKADKEQAKIDKEAAKAQAKADKEKTDRQKNKGKDKNTKKSAKE